VPNWCSNILDVTGSPQALARFAEAVSIPASDPADPPRDTRPVPLSFERILPTPPELCLPGADGWYKWRVNNWGTKWDLDGDTYYTVFPVEGGLERRRYVFDTAWSPALGIYQQMAHDYLDLIFEAFWAETGNCFAGRSTFVDGREIEFIEAGEPDHCIRLAQRAGFPEIADSFQPYEEEEEETEPEDPAPTESGDPVAASDPGLVETPKALAAEDLP